MNRIAVTGVLAGVVSAFMMNGCSGASEAERNAQRATIAAMTAERTSLKTANDSLNTLLTATTVEKNALAAREAECEKQTSDLRAQVAALTAPPQPVASARAKSAPAVAISAEGRDAYSAALTAFHDRKYTDATDRLTAILASGAPGGLEDNCVYWIGECLYARHKYADAIEQFRKVFDYKRSEKKDDAQFMIGNAYAALGDAAHAKEEYQRFERRFPASPYITFVKARLGKL